MMRLFARHLKIFFIFCFFYLTYSLSVNAENLENVIQNIERIEKDVQDLQKEIYRDKKTISNNDSLSGENNIAVFDLRIRDIENQISQLIEYVEEYVFKIDELNDRIDDLLLKQSENMMTQTSTKNQDENNVNNESQISFEDNENQTLGSLSISGIDITEENNNILNENLLPDTGPEEQYQFAFNLLRSQKLNEAKRALEEFIDRNETHSLAGSASYWIGEIIYLNGNYKEAALTFAEAYQKYPTSIKVPDMLLRLSVSLSKIEKTEQACFTLNEMINNYPDSKLITKAKKELELLQCQ